MSLSLSTILPHQPVSCTYSREERVAHQAPTSGVMQHQIARGATALLGTRSSCPISCSSQGTAGGGSRRNHNGTAATARVPGTPESHPDHSPPPALQHQSCRRQWPPPRGPGAPLHGLGTVSLTWIIIPFALYSACRALENVHTKAWKRGRNTSEPGAGFLRQNQLCRFQRAPQEPTTLS